MEPKVIIIVGPTCSGKTRLSLQIAEMTESEIISADSRQVYKLLNIGTAKPSKEELRKVKHHFVDILFPDEEFNASIFENSALQIIKNIFKKEKTPIVAGGSGLYIKALVDGLFDSVGKDDVYREELKRKRTFYGNDFLYNELKKVDPVSAEKMLPQNWKRVMRALEVFHITGEPIWKHHQDHTRNVDYKFEQYGLKWPREVLYKNIEARVDDMIKEGLVEEVSKVLAKGYSKSLNSFNTVGYKEIISYLDGEISLERAAELIKRNTRRFAKRQLTWFNADKRINWFEVNSQKDFTSIAEKIILKKD